LQVIGSNELVWFLRKPRLPINVSIALSLHFGDTRRLIYCGVSLSVKGSRAPVSRHPVNTHISSHHFLCPPPFTTYSTSFTPFLKLHSTVSFVVLSCRQRMVLCENITGRPPAILCWVWLFMLAVDVSVGVNVGVGVGSALVARRDAANPQTESLAIGFSIKPFRSTSARTNLMNMSS
jgi:hypothetical protein